MMTTADASAEGSPTPGQTSRESSMTSGSSVHVIRARKLLFGGLVGGVAAAIVSVVGFGIGYGQTGAVTALIAAAMVLFFYAAGQLIMVMFADAGARTLLLVSLMSYSTRVIVLGLVLMAYGSNRAAWPNLVPMAMFVTTIACVAGWLAVEILVFSRLRIGAYDTEYVPPATESSDGMSAQ